MPTPYATRHRVEVSTFLERYRSIPAFTANLTMELFNARTQG